MANGLAVDGFILHNLTKKDIVRFIFVSKEIRL